VALRLCHGTGGWLVAGYLPRTPGFALRAVCGARRGPGTGFSSNPTVILCQCHSTAVPFSLMYHVGDGQKDR
jgi:hypothetical protein